MGIEGYVQNAEAVHDVTEPDPDLRAEPGRAFSMGLDFKYTADSIWASACIERFGRINADERWVPELEITMDAWANEMAKVTGLPMEDCDDEIRAKLRQANVREGAQMMERVSLDLTPETPGRPQNWLHPTAPMVIFLKIKPGTHLYREDRRGMAIWFMPNTDEDNNPLDAYGDPLTEFRGRLTCDTRYMPGYGGILEFFASHHLMREAAEELERAVRIIGTPREDGGRRGDDDPGEVLQREIDKSDAVNEQAAKRSAARRRVVAF